MEIEIRIIPENETEIELLKKLDVLFSKVGSGSSVNIDLGTLSGGYHLLEFEFVEVSGSGWLNFHVATATGNYAWLVRFRIYVPNYSNNTYEYTVTTTTNFPSDEYYFGGFADDYIKDIWVDTNQKWYDWMWNMGSYGTIYGWSDGFMYPLNLLQDTHTVKFRFGNNGSGLLDFQYISSSNQPDKIGKPRFWARISPPTSSYPSGSIRHLDIYDVESWAGSDWASAIGSSRRLIAAGLRVLANATDTNTFYPIPQEAEVTLILDLPSYQWPLNSLQDIGLHINVTYTYFNEQYFVYSFPIWFETKSIELKVSTQGLMLYVPYPSIVFSDRSQTTFITPDWKAAYDALKWATTFILLGLGPVGAIGAGYTQYRMSEYMYRTQQQLNSTWEELGPPTYRKYHMNIFKTTMDQAPLSEPVKSISNGFFLRMSPSASKYCGGINFTLQGRLWLPFFYSGEPPPDSPNWYGEWLPIDIEISIAFPVFVKE
jgi:hypothetical protein